MTGRDVLRRAERLGCWRVRQRGSHVIVRCRGGCQTVIPIHRGQDLPAGTLRSIERLLAPCLGEAWLR
jgi:predicted RNA binding protein YcfA (HicA-like mRNA interferase family)